MFQLVSLHGMFSSLIQNPVLGKAHSLHWAADGVGHSSAMFPVRGGGGGRAAGGGGGGEGGEGGGGGGG